MTMHEPVEPTPALLPKDMLDSQIKLYSLLVDQLQRYNTIVWQLPTALLALNLVVVGQLANQPGQPWWLLGVAAFDGSMVYGFRKIVMRQSALIRATKLAEDRLRRGELADPVAALDAARSARHLTVPLRVVADTYAG